MVILEHELFSQTRVGVVQWHTSALSLLVLTCPAMAQNLDSTNSRVIWTPMAVERERKNEGGELDI